MNDNICSNYPSSPFLPLLRPFLSVFFLIGVFSYVRTDARLPVCRTGYLPDNAVFLNECRHFPDAISGWGLSYLSVNKRPYIWLYDTMTCRMDNQTGNKSEQTYRCQNEVDVECSLFLHDYYMLGLAGTVRGSTWTIYGFCGSRLEIFLLFSKRAG